MSAIVMMIVMVKPESDKKAIEPRPCEYMTFLSAKRIGRQSGVSRRNAERLPLIVLEATVSQSQA